MQLEDLFHFLQAGVTPFHAAAEAARLLDAAGYTRLEESAYWNLEAGRGYYVTRNNSAVIAWRIPAHAIGGWPSRPATAIRLPGASRTHP